MEDNNFICPISRQIFRNPVLASDGYFYEETEIGKWFYTHDTSPMTNLIIDKKIIKSLAFNLLLNDFLTKNPDISKDQYIVENINPWKEINMLIKNNNFKELLKFEKFSLNDFAENNFVLILECSNKEIIEYVVKNIVDFNKIDLYGFTLLHYLFEHCSSNIDLIKYVLNKKINLEVADIQGYNVMHVACAKRHGIELVKLLINKNINLECETTIGKWRPIHVAIGNGYLELVQLLMNKGVNLECETKVGKRPIHFACQYSSFEIIQLLINKGVNLECETRNGKRPIHFACKRGFLEPIQLLINKGVSLVCNCNRRLRPSDYILLYGTFIIIDYYLSNNTELDIRATDHDISELLSMNNKISSSEKARINEIIHDKQQITNNNLTCVII